MAKNVYPTMDTNGFLTDDQEIAVRILNDYVGTHYSQSVLFLQQLKSLDYTVKTHSHNYNQLVTMIQMDLDKMYSSYLDNVTVEVSHNPFIDTSTGKDTGQLEIKIGVWFNYKGNVAALTQAVLVNQDIIERIWDVVIR